jgi:hypothetical protein
MGLIKNGIIILKKRYAQGEEEPNSHGVGDLPEKTA